ncbi:hypothetical protein C8J57DRAFT_1545404 [Mycena rebaudengoi]|nr:hypothetical protein C8J57DRAFT_1545404 [Mycena rebaudengoi]
MAWTSRPYSGLASLRARAPMRPGLALTPNVVLVPRTNIAAWLWALSVDRTRRLCMISTITETELAPSSLPPIGLFVPLVFATFATDSSLFCGVYTPWSPPILLTFIPACNPVAAAALHLKA